MSPILRALKAASVIRICFALLLGFLSAFPVLASFTPAAGTNTFTAVASDAARSATHIVVANFPSTVTYAYDNNGNLTSDGQRGYAYDDENQLTSVTLTNVIKSEFTYDGWRRLRLKQDYQWAASAWQQTNQIQYVYDGSLVIQERCFDPRVSSVQPVKLISYTRGVDLSGGLQGAGGIGGLLARTEQTGTSTHLYYHSDLGGNITALVNTNDVVVGRYQYDPYGNVSMMSGEAAESNTYRFSSKAYDSNFDLYYYGYRFYVPALQRWLNRDPSGERGGINLYAFASSRPLNSVDFYGLWSFLKWLYTGDGNSSDEIYDSALEVAGEGLVEQKDSINTSLDVIGVADPSGIADGLNLLVNLGFGDSEGAAISACSMIPFIGDAAKLGKYGVKGADGVIYKVPGCATPSGRDYIGRTTHPDGPPGRGKSDGRDRSDAEIVDTYNGTEDGRFKEQAAIDANGGLKNLDNKRNEISKGKGNPNAK